MTKKSKTKKKNKSIGEILTSTKSLTIIFVALFVFVLVLGGFLVARKMKENPKANMVIAIMNQEKNYGFYIDANSLREKDSYLLKVTNYRGPSINEEDVNYSITFSNPTDGTIAVKKLVDFKEVGEDLMIEQDGTKIVDEKLKKGEKREIWYKVTLTKKGNIKEKDLISVLIES